MPTIATKPLCEKILPESAVSWRYWLYEVESLDFHWHYHPEYEICLTLNSRGKRYVGDDIQDYADLDLVLLGPDLPHAWTSNEEIKGQKQQVYVAQIPLLMLETMMKTLPECNEFKAMLMLSRRGVAFSQSVAVQAKTLFLQMHHADAMSRLILLMQLLHLLQADKQAVVLSSDHYSFVSQSDSATDKIDKVIQYIQQHYTESLSADDMARLAFMSTNHFHRFFKQKTEQTFGELITRLRIGKACSMLLTTELPINNISDACGFNNISNFNRRFLQQKNCTPSQFRKAYASKPCL